MAQLSPFVDVVWLNCSVTIPREPKKRPAAAQVKGPASVSAASAAPVARQVEKLDMTLMDAKEGKEHQHKAQQISTRMWCCPQTTATV